jgi:hypothetical protein
VNDYPLNTWVTRCRIALILFLVYSTPGHARPDDVAENAQKNGGWHLGIRPARTASTPCVVTGSR